MVSIWAGRCPSSRSPGDKHARDGSTRTGEGSYGVAIQDDLAWTSARYRRPRVSKCFGVLTAPWLRRRSGLVRTDSAVRSHPNYISDKCPVKPQHLCSAASCTSCCTCLYDDIWPAFAVILPVKTIVRRMTTYDERSTPRRCNGRGLSERPRAGLLRDL
jgi:hypothetical protein